MKIGLTFDDVCLVPQYNNVASRTEPELSTWLTKNRKTNLPIVPANMESVISVDLAKIVLSNGGLPILHRFNSADCQIKTAQELKSQCYISAGYGKWDEVVRIVETVEPLGICFDIAHGHSKTMIDLISKFKGRFNLDVIAGNVCTSQGYIDLVNAGADAIKVGVGPGAICSTRIVTGFGVPQLTAILDCAESAKKFKVPIIADGGISGSREVVLALAAGASSVMIGKLFALSEESAAAKRNTPANRLDFIREAKYRGQASADFQNDYYGGVKEKTVAEGVDYWAPVTGRAQDVIDSILGGLRSGLTYGGAKSIKELQRKAEFMSVTASYGKESGTRK